MLGAALSVVGIGLPLLLAAAAFCRALVRLDRRAANRWLDAQVPPIPPPALGTAARSGARSTCSRTARCGASLAHLALRPLLVAARCWSSRSCRSARSRLLLQLGVGGLAGAGDVDYVGPWALGAGARPRCCARSRSPPAALAHRHARGAAHAARRRSRARCSPRGERPEGPGARDARREPRRPHASRSPTGCPTASASSTSSGRPVELPEPGSGRAWTAVERDGRRVAAIVHDAALDTSPELVKAAAAGASLAIDNERLKADLRARVEELRVSRLRIIEAGDAARRRIERDLHDGAQQQLVSLALDLRMLKARSRQRGGRGTIDELSERLATALAELRELARGIHPAILTDRGLAPADRRRSPTARRCRSRPTSRSHERLTPRDRGRRLLRRRRGADQRRRYAQADNALVDLRRDDAT